MFIQFGLDAYFSKHFKGFAGEAMALGSAAAWAVGVILARQLGAHLPPLTLNLLKNAHESGSPPEQVALQVKSALGMVRIDVMDRGQGMNDAVLTNALVPFYSTKRSGTGLGLALAREIAEAHGGRITLGNREGGGLTVTLVLPVPTL